MKKHGYYKHPLYVMICNIVQRCCNPINPNFKNYGGRGITICKEWRDNLASFVEWGFENGWKHGLDIDRMNNNKGYSPSNCRFVSRGINLQNTRVTKLTPRIVLNILKDIRDGQTHSQIAEKYQTDKARVSRIRNGKTWSSVTGIKDKESANGV